MYFWKTDLLVADLRKSALGEKDFKNYYLATSILIVVGFYLTMLEAREDMLALAIEAIGTLVVTVVGLNAAFTANGGPAGVRFLEKAVSISFPLLMRVVAAGFAMGFLIGALEIYGINKSQMEWVGTTAIIAIQGVFFWRLVVHVRSLHA